MTKTTLKTKACYEISTHIFEPVSPGKSVVLILPANGTKQAFYSNFARYLKSKSHIVYTLDYGGIGESKMNDLHSFDTSITNWGKYDLEAVLGAIKNNHSDKRLVVIAHSIGGQIFGLAPSSLSAYKLIFVAVPSGYLNFWTGIDRMKMILTWNFLFSVLPKLYGYMPASKISGLEDLPKSAALEWKKWCLSPNYLFDHIPVEALWYDQIECGLISYSIADDAYAPKQAVDWFTNCYRNCRIVRRHFDPKALGISTIGHSGFFKKSNSNIFWPMLLNDIEE